MVGLIQQGMQQQPPQEPMPPNAQQPPEGQQAQQGEPPQQGGERGQFEPIVERMLSYVYGDGLQRIEGVLESGDPVDSMGQVIGMVMTTVYNALGQNGRSVQPNVMVRAGIELSKAIGEMAMEMGVVPQGEDEAIEMAFLLGLGNFGRNANDMPPEEKQQYAQIARGLKEGKQAAQGGQPQGGQPPQGQPQGAQPPQQPMQPGGV